MAYHQHGEEPAVRTLTGAPMPRLSATQASAVRYLLQLPGTNTPARTTILSLMRSGVVVGPDARQRVDREHRAELCGPAGLTDAERAVVDAALERWRRWDLEALAAHQEADACRRLVDSLPEHLRHYGAASERSLDRLATRVADYAESVARSAADYRAEAARVTRRAESYEADAATLRDLAEAARATPRPTTGA